MIKVNSYKFWKKYKNLGALYRVKNGIDFQNTNCMSFWFDLDFDYLKESNYNTNVYRVNYYYSSKKNKIFKVYYLDKMNLKESEKALKELLSCYEHLQLKFIKSIKR